MHIGAAGWRAWMMGAALLGSVSAASADIIEVTYGGIVTNGFTTVFDRFPPYLISIDGVHFTTDYIFDTSLGTLSPGMLTGGLLFASITFDDGIQGFSFSSGQPPELL
jgi:hypothetical protein